MAGQQHLPGPPPLRQNEGVGVEWDLNWAGFGERSRGHARRRAQPRQRCAPAARGAPSAHRSGCAPLIVRREPAECLLMFPFAFGCRSGSVFSFPGCCHRHPPSCWLTCLLRSNNVPGLPELFEDSPVLIESCVCSAWDANRDGPLPGGPGARKILG